MKLGKPLPNINEKNNFIYLTLALIMLLISSALVQLLQDNAMDYVMQGIIVVTFIVCFVSLHFDHKWTRFLRGLAVVWLGAITAQHLFHIQKMDLLMLALTFVFFYGTFQSLIRQILFAGKIDTNKLIGSLALFLLLGLMWAVAYLLLLELDPQAFHGLQAIPWADNFSNSAYFSFVTLTTLGYGDISPVTPIAKTLVYLESVVGVFYMAVVVSSLVSSNLGGKSHQ
ncbi:two pore domain potassium channel family protein [Vibrio cholerae]|uniref:potassium channel family protein n=1 Tax=Vibrio cholerae TaxID=666 RepID=UPI0011DB5F95|nr:potassium channel family protein [Vibrio cholerae]EGR0363252.1 two pore domain potassium channel family protein [Vibrio cholerae]EGR0936619.1 two pore domain potassium channel family protein [Vibrio cholerae]EIA0767547.1 two pore domain potassium channel family protein [Vibrio cholerae]EID0157802.1 two pore domain potassium channel family protein [Vibrio cholerae]EJL6347855.1 two pore domain potassium channel family protein [Vibrio cholerae]